MSTFTDSVLNRRKKSFTLEDRVAASINRQLLNVHRKAMTRLNELRKFEKDGVLKNTTESRRAAQAAIADVKDTVQSATTKSGKIMARANQTAFRDGILDASYSAELHTGQDLQLGGTFNQIFKEAVHEARTREVLGVNPLKSFSGSRKWQEDRYKEIFSNAVISGESIDETAKKLRNVSSVTSRTAERIARTNVQAAMNDAHRLTYEANNDLFDGFIWVSTLDERTSAICAALDGKFFPLGSKPPGPPAHPNCRSVLVGHFKDPDLQEEQEQDERRARTFDDEGNRTGDELIPADTSFEDWMKRQPDKVTTRITGSKTRDKLWREGKLDLEEMVNPNMEPLNDAQAIQRALAKNPGDPELQQLVKDYGVKPVKQSTIDRRDKKMIADSEHTQPVSLAKPTPETAPPPIPPDEVQTLTAKKAAKRKDDIVDKGEAASLARTEQTLPPIPKKYKEANPPQHIQWGMSNRLGNRHQKEVIDQFLEGKSAREIKTNMRKVHNLRVTNNELKDLERTAFTTQYRAETQTLGRSKVYGVQRMEETSLKAKYTKNAPIGLDSLTEGFKNVRSARSASVTPRAFTPGEVEVTFEYVAKKQSLSGARTLERFHMARGQRFSVKHVIKTRENRFKVVLQQVQ